MFVLKDGAGQIVLTNLGPRKGYKIVTRYREFKGSGALGLKSSVSARDKGQYDALVGASAKRFEVDPLLIKAVIRAESNFNPMATSPKGAMGLMQLMPDTARFHGVRNAYDPSENVHGGVRHLRGLIDRYQGKLDWVLAAYNAGTVPVDRARGIPNYAETREYVRRVHAFHGAYAKQPPPVAPARPDYKAAVAKLEFREESLDEIYGKPIVLRDQRGPNR